MIGDGGQVDARRVRGLEVFGAGEWQFAVILLGDVLSIGGILLLALSELTGFGGGFLLCLDQVSNSRGRGAIEGCTFSFSFWAFFKAFLEGSAGAAGAAAPAAGAVFSSAMLL